MTPERWQQIEEIFQTVVELPADDRKGFLTTVCDGDDELQREVQSLLKHEAFDTFIQEPILGAAQSLAVATENDLIGQQFGQYRITALLGVGGMGAVYAAIRDEQFTQQVAIKIVKRGMDSGFVLKLVIHRDIKPGNIMVNEDSVAKLLDFGVAKLLTPVLSKAEPARTAPRTATRAEHMSPLVTYCSVKLILMARSKITTSPKRSPNDC